MMTHTSTTPTHSTSSSSSSSPASRRSSSSSSSLLLMPVSLSLLFLLVVIPSPALSQSHRPSGWLPTADQQQVVCSQSCIAAGRPLELCCVPQSESSSPEASKRGGNNQGYMPFRYGRKRHMPFRYGKRSAVLPPKESLAEEESSGSGSLWKRQFRYGKRRLMSALSSSSPLLLSSSDGGVVDKRQFRYGKRSLSSLDDQSERLSSSDGGVVDKRQFRYGKRSLSSLDDQSESAYQPLPSLAEEQQ